MSYEAFAEFYDLLNTDADYAGRTEALLEIFRRYGAAPRLLLDAACGTGGFTLPFLRAGVDVIGADLSEDMLALARAKAAGAGFSPLLLRQRLSELDLYGTVDGALCAFDSLNHIGSEGELADSVSRVSLFLEPGSLFLFDLNTLYKHRELLGHSAFIYDFPEVYCVWQNSFDDETGRVDIALDFFVPQKDGYRRLSEDFSEYYYGDAQILMILERAGLELLELLDGDTFARPEKTSQRKLFITRKRTSDETKDVSSRSFTLSRQKEDANDSK